MIAFLPVHENSGRVIGLFPLNGCRGLTCDVVYNPIDPRNFIYNARADAVQNIVGDTGPVSGHKIIGRDGAKGQGMVIGAAIAHDAHRAGIGENGEELFWASRDLESSSRKMKSARRRVSAFSLVTSPMMRMASPGPGKG